MSYQYKFLKPKRKFGLVVLVGVLTPILSVLLSQSFQFWQYVVALCVLYWIDNNDRRK